MCKQLIKNIIHPSTNLYPLRLYFWTQRRLFNINNRCIFTVSRTFVTDIGSETGITEII